MAKRSAKTAGVMLGAGLILGLGLTLSAPLARATHEHENENRREVDAGDIRGADHAGSRTPGDLFMDGVFGAGREGTSAQPAATGTTEHIWEDSAAGHRWKTTTTRRADGTRTEREEPADDRQFFYTETDYDAEGRPVAARGGNTTGQTWTREYQHEEDGRVRSITNYTSGITIVDVEQNGRLLRTLQKDKDGNLTERTDYSYNSKGETTRIQTRDYVHHTVTTDQFDMKGNVETTVTDMATGERIQPEAGKN